MSARLDGAGRLAVPAVSVALALVLLLGIALAALRGPTASAATVLARGAAVSATLPDGTRTTLAPGAEVPRGAVVRAGPDGAVLRTRDRDTWLSGDAVVRVVDGARQELRAGFVMVDARRGPELELSAPSAVVSAPPGGVTRIEDGRLLRVGSYAGEPVTVRAAGRAAAVAVPRSRQVQVPAGGLPGRVTPLVLTPDDAYERALAPDLVSADGALAAVAARLDGGGRPAVLVRAAAAADLAGQQTALPPGAPSSERTLAYLLARAAGDPGRYGQVRGLRADGGSWGVVADLVGARVGAVAGLLDELLGASEVVLAGAEVDVAALLGAGAATPAPTTAPAPGGDPAVVAPPPAPPAPPAAPQEQPPPQPEPEDPGGGPGDVVAEVVATVLGLLPDQPASSPTVPALPGDAVPEPTAPPDPGLLSDLLSR